ncbi:hypothetical protein D3C85_949630 [compost metagenome]
MLRIAGLHICRAQELEASLLKLRHRRPDFRQSRVDRFGRIPQPDQIVGLRRVQRRDEQDGVVEILRSLMEMERR